MSVSDRLQEVLYLLRITYCYLLFVNYLNNTTSLKVAGRVCRSRTHCRSCFFFFNMVGQWVIA